MAIVAGPVEIVPGTSPAMPSDRWQTALKAAVRDGRELCRLLGLDPELADAGAAESFGVFVPRGFLARMRPGDPHDPLLRQVLAIDAERQPAGGFTTDPVGDSAATVVPGLLHKYTGRVLLVLTGACAVHCRYCFRRHFPYEAAPPSPAVWRQALRAIADDDSIHEVILSGGDPLMLTDPVLAELVAELATIPHLRRLRVHTRLPIVLPERVTMSLVEWLTGSRLAPVMVVHANHPQELDDTVAAALARLAEAGVPLLNQAVLLRGVNDDLDTLVELSERLVDLRVMPYYLHQLDRVAGAAHFEVPAEQGLLLVEQLRARLPGYAVPRYVRELAGQGAKMPVEPGDLS